METPAVPGPAVGIVSAKAGTIRRLVAAARQEFARNGYSETRIDDIAHAASVTKQLLYHYFKDKEELFACVLADVSAEIMGELLERDFDSEPPVVAFRGFVDAIIDQYCRDPMLGPLAGEGMRYHHWHASRSGFPRVAPELLVKFQRLLERGIEAGAFRPDIDARMVLGLTMLAGTGAFTSRYLLSAILGVDSTSAAGIDEWRRSVGDLLVGAIAARA